MRILELRAARGWSVEQAAQKFLVTEDTIASWVRRVDEGGERPLVQIEEPVNKFPEFVAHLVRSLKLMCPTLGKVRIAQVLARAGLHLGVTTVGRMLGGSPREYETAEEPVVTTGKVVTAKYPGHVWQVDLTVVPTGGGFCVPWLPFARPQRRPTSLQVCAFLDRAIKRAGSTPRHMITDKGKEFDCRPFKRWCRGRGIRPRFGAVGEHGSIAVIERVIRSMKSECARRVLVPLRLDAMRHELGCYATWYNEHRPHTALGGCTPLEMWEGISPANEKPRFEPRAR